MTVLLEQSGGQNSAYRSGCQVIYYQILTNVSQPGILLARVEFQVLSAGNPFARLASLERIANC